MPTFDQLRFSLTFDPNDQPKAMAYEQLRSHMLEILRQTVNPDPADKLERQGRLFAVVAILVKHFSKPLTIEEAAFNAAI